MLPAYSGSFQGRFRRRKRTNIRRLMARRPRGVLLPPVSVSHPRRAEVYLALRNALRTGLLAPGERLQSSRRAAADYGVSRGLLEEVYSQLMHEGLLERSVGRGTFIANRVAKPPIRAHVVKTPDHVGSVSTRGQILASNRAA